MTSWKGFKTAAALLLAVTGLSLAPGALAEAAYPPTGKYYNVDDNKVIWYDSVTKLVTDLEEAVSPHQCFDGQLPPGGIPEGQCGNCLYAPDGTNTWTLATTQYTYGECVNINAYGEVGGSTFGVGRYRADVRIYTKNYYGYAYEVVAKGYGDGSGWIGQKQVLDWYECSESSTLNGRVYFCADIPRDADVRDEPWFSQADEICYEIKLWHKISEYGWGFDPALSTKSCERA